MAALSPGGFAHRPRERASCLGASRLARFRAGARDNFDRGPSGPGAMGEMQMTIPITFLAASLRPTPVGAPPASPSGLKNELFANARRRLDKLSPLAFARYLIAFFIGVAATVAWQSWNGRAGAAPPEYQQFNAILLDSVKQRIIDQITTRIASLEEQMTRGLERLGASQEQLAASHEQMTRDIAKLQATVSKNPEPSPRLAPGAAHRQLQAPTEADARPDWRRQSCCQWPASTSR
jgi:hypothetical protein